MADERDGRRDRRILTRFRRGRARRRLVGLVLAAAVVAVALGPSAVTAEGAERSFGRVIVTVEGVGGHGPAEPVRYEVDALLTAESSAFRAGVVCRFELPRVVGDDYAVVTLDLDLDALLGARALPIGGFSARLEYREVALETGDVTYAGAGVEGDVLLLAVGPREQGLRLHVAFGAVVRDAFGQERLLTDGEAATLPDEATHPSTVVVWRDDTPPDVIFLDALYASSDCSGDPLYEPGYVIEPAAYGPEPYGDEVEDGTGWGGVDWGYGAGHAGVDPDDGSVAPGDDDWQGWAPGDNWSEDDEFLDDGWDDGSVDPSGGDDGGWDPGDDGPANDWDDGSWDDTSDPGGGCGGEDDPGYEDDSVDCAGDDPSGGDSGFDCSGDGGDTSSGDAVDTSCDGGDGVEGESDPLDFDCDSDATASVAALSGDGPRPGPPRHHRRWRGWNLFPLLGFLGWWAFLRFRRGAPLPVA